MDNPLVSIIIPTYNYGHFLSETLDAILEQSYENWECLIVDDGSTDNTKEVVLSYTARDKRFIYIYQDNKGLSGARNTGLKNAKGSFLQLLDSDDKIESHKVALQVQEMVSNPSIDILYGSVRYFTTEDPAARYFDLECRLSKSWMPEVSGSGWEILSQLIVNNIMVVNAPIFKASFIPKVGYFDEELGAVEDWDFWLRCAVENLNFQYFDQLQTLALVRTHISMSRNKKLMISATIQLRNKLNRLLIERVKNNDLIKVNKILLGHLYNELIFEDINGGQLYSGWKKTASVCLMAEQPLFHLRESFKYTRRFLKRKFLSFFN